MADIRAYFIQEFIRQLINATRLSKKQTPPLITQPTQSRIEAAPSIDSYILDPEIDTIEIQGPDKPVLIQKNGIQTPIPLRLTEAEINKLLEKISAELHSKPEEKIIRGNYLTRKVTAIRSDFVGNRITFQKRPAY